MSQAIGESLMHPQLATLGRFIMVILNSLKDGLYLYVLTMKAILQFLASLIFTGISNLFSSVGSALFGIGKTAFAFGFPFFVGFGIAGFLLLNGASAALFWTIWTGINIGVLSCLKFIIPNAIRVAAFNYAPTLISILPGVLASIAARILPQIWFKPPQHPDNIDHGAAVAGATTFLAIASRSAAYTPALATALNAPASLTWLAATSIVTVAGMNAGQATREYFRP